MGRKQDDLWDYAERSDKRFKCRFCLKDFTGGVVRLRSHLSGVKGGGIQLCSEVSEQAKNDALSSPNVVNKKRKTGPSSSDSDGGSSDICDANCNSEVGDLLAKFFEMADIDYSMVESSSFINLVNALRPGFTLPSSLELESKLIPSFKAEVEQYVSGAKRSWIKTGCTLIPIFEQNENEGRSLLSIFGCSRERIVLLYTFEVPSNIDLVIPFLQQSVDLVVEAVGSGNIVQCVVDASQYGEYFSKFLGSKFPHVYLTKCAAREVQLMFDEICQDVEWVQTTFNIINSIADYICSDKSILALMSKYTNGKELKQSLGVDCLSSYKMLESILEVKEGLAQLVQSPEWLASGYGAGQRGREVTAYIVDLKTWELGEKVQKALRSLSQVLCLVDFHDSGSGYLYGLMEIVEHSISLLWNNNQDMYQRFWNIYRLKKGHILSEFHSVAAFLNPAYMCTEQAKYADTNQVINSILGRFIDAGDKEAFVNEVGEYMTIFSNGSKPFETTAAKIYHPCQWWESCGKKLPILRNLAIRILSQPCSTSACKHSMHTVEALLVKEQRELARGITNLDLKMNAILMERFNKDKAYHDREKIVLEEFSKQRSNNGESTSRPLRLLKLSFMTIIGSPIRISQNVEGQKGCRIHVCLEDPSTGRVVQDGIPSTLRLIISVLDGHFSNEAEEHSTREYFNRNELLGECPYITGDLGVTLIRGEGTLGNFSFNYNSVNTTKSGQFKLAVKTHTGVCSEFRILEGISNAFTVEDAEEVRPEIPVVHVDSQNGSFSSNSGEDWVSNIDPLTESESYLQLGQWVDTLYYPLQGFDQSLAQTAARRVKKKALTWQLQSRGRGVLKKGSHALGRKRRGKEASYLRRGVYSTGSNNVNQQEDGEEMNGEAVELKGIDSVSSASASAMRLFGFKGASLSSSKPVEEKNEVALTTCPSTALQLSLTGGGGGGGVLDPGEVQLASANNVNQQEDGKPMALKGIDILKPESPTVMLFGVQVAGGEEPTGEAHESQSPTPRVMLTTEDSKEISYDGYDAEIQAPGKKRKFLVGTFDTAEEAAIAYDVAARQFLDPYAETNFPIASEPEMNSTGRSKQEDDTPQEVEGNHCVRDNYKSDCSVKYTPTMKRAKYTDANNHGTGIVQKKTFPADYDVFLSFRGADTRHSFTEMLNQYMVDAGIKAFVDKPAKLSGDSLHQAVINAIENSKISICILSATYASSAWCLRELETMVQMNKVILPIFYGVAPDDVQLKTNMYTDDLARHETKYDKVEVQKWREALRKVGELKGFEPKRMSLLDSINELIGLISSKLKVKPNYELQHFVGIEDHVKNALSLLDIESGDNRILGIVGMGGIGKTTLAKCIYNRLLDKFDMSCFFEDVGVDSSMENKMARIRGLCQKKVLIVLDDVYHTRNPITDLFNTNWFGSGSRIIVTTRNRQCLANMKNVFWYDVEGMDPERALKLFSKKAFGQDSPPEEYRDLSERVVSICKGHPLALTVVGTFLHGQERPNWERVITDMQKGQSRSDDKLVIVVTTREVSFPDELCRGHPLVVRLMSSLVNGIGKQLWASKIDKVTGMVKSFQKMMTECKMINAITEAFGEMFRDMVRWGSRGGGSIQQLTRS